MRRFALVLVPLLALFAARPLHAADSAAQARELFQKGQRELDEGKSQEAIDTFEAAYKSGKAPSLLFYLAEAYRQAGQNAKAIASYKLYLEKVPKAPKKNEAEAQIAALKKRPAVEKVAAKAPKRKIELDDVDLDARPAAATAKAAPKKMELDDVELSGPTAGATAQAKADKRAAAKARRAAKKQAAADATAEAKQEERAAEKPAAAAPASTKDQIDLLAGTPPTSAAPANSGLAALDLDAPATPAASATPSVPPPSVATVPVAAAATPPPPPAPTPAPAPVVAAPPPLQPAPPPASVAVASNQSVSHGESSAHRTAPPLRATAPAPAPLMVSHEENSGGSGLRTTGIIVGSVGLAALVTGGIFGLGAVAASNDINDAAAQGKPYDPGVQDRGQRDQKLETVFLIGGGAALVGGVLLFVLAPSGSDASASENEHRSSKSQLSYVAILPTPGGASAAASLRF